jgi:hypothetical protein
MTRNHAPEAISVALPLGILATDYAIMWAACRSFSQRPLLPIWIALGPTIWFIACMFPSFFHSTSHRVPLASAINATYALAAA